MFNEIVIFKGGGKDKRNCSPSFAWGTGPWGHLHRCEFMRAHVLLVYLLLPIMRQESFNVSGWNKFKQYNLSCISVLLTSLEFNCMVRDFLCSWHWSLPAFVIIWHRNIMKWPNGNVLYRNTFFLWPYIVSCGTLQWLCDITLSSNVHRLQCY